MDIKIRNLGSIERGDIGFAGICLVAGLNGVGKTTLLRAVGAALAREALPIPGATKKAAGAFVRTGAESGGVLITSSEGNAVKLGYPAAKIETQGVGPIATLYATGLVDVLTLPEKERTAVLAEYIKSAPTFTDLEAEIVDAGIKPEVAKMVWSAVDKNGWDGAHTRAKDRGAELKGEWQGFTRENYGAAKAQSWAPIGWTDDLASKSQDGLETELLTARQALEAAVGAHAVSSTELERLQASAALVDELIGARDAAVTVMTDAQKAASEAEHELSALPVEGEKGVPCPHPECGRPLKVTVAPKAGVTFTVEALPEAKTLTPTAQKKLRMDRIAAEGTRDRAAAALTAATDAHARAKVAVERAEKDRDALGKIEAGVTGGTALDVERAREAARNAEAALDAFKAKIGADSLAKAIVVNQGLVAILAADGLRRKVLARGLEAFNRDRLLPLCVAANWKPVEVEPDMTITYGGRSALLSESEQYRVRAILQVAFAHVDNSEIVVLDRADVLLPKLRQQLFAMLMKSGVCALVAMSYGDARQVPDLARIGCGATYWIDGGHVKPLADALEAAAA